MSKVLKLLGALALALVVLVAAVQFVPGLHWGLHVRTTTEVPPPRVTRVKVTPINIGCFVQVSSEVELQANEHKSLGWFHLWTNTTTSRNHGIGRECVDNHHTTVTLMSDRATGHSQLEVVIGQLYAEGFIQHDGKDGPRTNPAFGQRFAAVFGVDGNQHVPAGLELIAQTLFQHSACNKDVVATGETAIRGYYTQLARSVGAEGASVHFQSVQEPPPSRATPSGTINRQLAAMGVQIPGNWDIKSLNPTCQLTVGALS